MISRKGKSKDKLITETCDKIKAFKSQASTVGKPTKTAQDFSLSTPEMSRHYLP
jgi:hypothetical protein